MAGRQRAVETASRRLQDTENINITARLNGKVLASKSVVTKRPALGELSNTITTSKPSVLDKKGQSRAVAPSVQNPLQKKPATKSASTSLLLNTKKPESSIRGLVSRRPITRVDTLPTIREPGFSSSQLENVLYDVDSASKLQPHMVPEYANDIFDYLREMEQRFPIKGDFLCGHPSTPKMRAILVDWLVDVHQSFKLLDETLHLCVALIDRFLQANRHVGRDNLQLVGTSALLVACKYEEIYVVDLSDFAYISDNSYTKAQILEMERSVLKTIDFNLGRPLSIHFLRRFSKIAKVNSEMHELAKFLLELALLDYSMCHLRPSLQAAAACCFAIGIINEVLNLKTIWTPLLTHHSTYEYADLRPHIINYAKLITTLSTTKYKSIQTKYARSNKFKISLNPKLQGPLVKQMNSRSK